MSDTVGQQHGGLSASDVAMEDGTSAERVIPPPEAEGATAR